MTEPGSTGHWWSSLLGRGRITSSTAAPDADDDEMRALAEAQQLFRLHDYVIGQLAERRERAGTYLAVNGAIFGSAVAALLSPPVQEVVRAAPGAALLEGPFVAIGFVALLVALIGLNPGLPWERRPGPELIGWLIGLVLGASLRGPRAARLRSSYDASPLSYRRIRTSAIASPSPARAIIDLAKGVDTDAIAARIELISEQLHQVRLWRRFVTALTLIDVLLFASATVWLAGSSSRLSYGELLGGVAAALIACTILALGLRLPISKRASSPPPPLSRPPNNNGLRAGPERAAGAALSLLVALVALASWREFGQVLALVTGFVGFGTYAVAARLGNRTRALAFSILVAIVVVDVLFAFAQLIGWS